MAARLTRSKQEPKFFPRLRLEKNGEWANGESEPSFAIRYSQIRKAVTVQAIDNFLSM
jgi:hypothetical protein